MLPWFASDTGEGARATSCLKRISGGRGRWFECGGGLWGCRGEGWGWAGPFADSGDFLVDDVIVGVEFFGDLFCWEAGLEEGVDFLAEEIHGGGGNLAGEFGGEGAAGVEASADDAVAEIDFFDVHTNRGDVGVELFGDVDATVAGEEQLGDQKPALGSALENIERGRSGCAEPGGEGVAVGDVFLLTKHADVRVHVLIAHRQIAGDFGDGPAVEQPAQDLIAARGAAVEVAGAAVLAEGLVPGRFLDFAAKKQAGGEVADENIPTAWVYAEGLDLVALPTGKGRRGPGWEVGVGEVFEAGIAGLEGRPLMAFLFVMKNIDVEEAWARNRDGVIDGADFFFAGGAEPAPAPEFCFIFVSVPVGSAFGMAKDGAADDGLFEIIGDGIGEVLPEWAADGVGGGEKAAGGWVEESAGVEDGDGVAAVFTAEAADGAFGELGGVAGVAQAGGRAAEHFGQVGHFFAPIIEADGADVFAEGVGTDEDFVLDGLVGVSGVIEVHCMLGGDHPMRGGDAAIAGADGEAVMAEGAGEGGGAAAGNAFLQLVRVFLQPRPDPLPGFENQAFDVGHTMPPVVTAIAV
jgi:hypothetical protein